MAMRPATHVRRLILLTAVVAAALISWSCVNGAGVGVGVGAPARWGGGSSPPIFVGGPA